MDDQELREHFNFDEADLQANRNWQFTEKQKAHLVLEDKFARIARLIGGIFLVLISLGG